MPTDFSLDVRQVVPRERHSLVFSTFEVLKPGEGFILIADHEPQPLGRQFETRCAISSPGIISNKARQSGAFASAASPRR